MKEFAGCHAVRDSVVTGRSGGGQTVSHDCVNESCSCPSVLMGGRKKDVKAMDSPQCQVPSSVSRLPHADADADADVQSSSSSDDVS